MVLADSGEDTIVVCPDCEYGANIEAAVAKPKTYDANSEVKVITMKALYDEGETKIVHFAMPSEVELQDVKACNAVGANELVECEESSDIHYLSCRYYIRRIRQHLMQKKSHTQISQPYKRVMHVLLVVVHLLIPKG